MKYLVLGIIFLYAILALAMILGHFGVAQRLVKYLFGFHILLVFAYLIELKLK